MKTSTVISAKKSPRLVLVLVPLISVESLAKKYEEKYRQAGNVASKLTFEEATFHDIQERKMELYKAIVKMEQEGDSDGGRQARADDIQSSLEKLVKSLRERCKKYGLRGKPTTLLELPFGNISLSGLSFCSFLCLE